LVCVAKLEIDNVMRSAKQLIHEGMTQGFELTVL